jgi:hypothetical protein
VQAHSARRTHSWSCVGHASTFPCAIGLAPADRELQAQQELWMPHGVCRAVVHYSEEREQAEVGKAQASWHGLCSLHQPPPASAQHPFPRTLLAPDKREAGATCAGAQHSPAHLLQRDALLPDFAERVAAVQHLLVEPPPGPLPGPPRVDGERVQHHGQAGQPAECRLILRPAAEEAETCGAGGWRGDSWLVGWWADWGKQEKQGAQPRGN